MQSYYIVPTIADRAWQCLAKYVLEPAHEATFHERSYGFRPGVRRSAHDCQKTVFLQLRSSSNGKNKRVIELDIKKCFDNINHNFIIELVKMLPGIEYVEGWLKAGYLEKEVFNSTESGTPQGAIISPLLANIALDRIEKHISRLTYQVKNFKKRQKW